MSLVQRDNRNISLNDILMPLEGGVNLGQFLSLHDYIINDNSLHAQIPVDDASGILAQGSIEYELCFPVDMEKAFRYSVIGLNVRLRQANNSPDGGFSFDVFFSDDVPSFNNEVGESDLEGLVKQVKQTRRSAVRATLTDPILGEGNPNVPRREVSAEENVTTDHRDIFDYSVRRGLGMPIEEVFEGRLGGVFEEFPPEEMMSLNDLSFRSPRHITDKSNPRGISLLAVKNEILEREIEQGLSSFNAKRAAINSLQDPGLDSSVIGESRKVDYSSSILPVRRIVRIHKDKLDYLNPTMVVTPIRIEKELFVDPSQIREPIQGAGHQGDSPGRSFGLQSVGVTPVESTHSFSVSSEFSDLMNPIGNPEMRIISQSPGSITVQITKVDPTLERVRLEIDYVNPSMSDSSIPVNSKILKLSGLNTVCTFTGVYNNFPVIPTLTCYSLANNRDEVVSSVTKKIKSFESSLTYTSAGLTNSTDTMILNARTTREGISLSFMGSLGRDAEEIRVRREDVSSTSATLRDITIGPVLDRITEQDRIIDRNVINGRTYRYYLEYKRRTAVRTHPRPIGSPQRPLSLGSNQKGFSSHVSRDDILIKFLRPRETTDIHISAPRLGTEDGNPGVAIDVTFNQEPGVADLADILNFLGENAAPVDRITNSSFLSQKIPMLLIERINRVDGSIVFVSVVALQKQKTITSIDNSIYSAAQFQQNVMGRFTYKMSVLKPTVGALQGIKIPVSKANSVGEPRKAEVNALKYTSEVFLRDGILNTDENLSSPTFIETIMSFDTQERFYVDFDPKSNNSENLTAPVLSVSKLQRGFKLNWSVSPEMSAATHVFLVFKELQSTNKKKLIKVVKSSRNQQDYTYRDVSLIVPPSLVPDAEYSILPVSSNGDYLYESNTVNTFSQRLFATPVGDVVTDVLPFQDNNNTSVQNVEDFVFPIRL